MLDAKLNSVTPVLQVGDLPRAIAFYRDALGFEAGWSFGEPPWLASVCRDVVEFHLHAAEKPVPCHVYLNVTNVDEYFTRAITAGAKLVYPLEDRHYGMRDGRIEDPYGNHISMGENLERE